VSTAAEHYADLLGPVYVWMSGGLEAAFAAGDAEVEPLVEGLAPGTRVVDLGAGFGMHAVPLARRGFPVTAIDGSAELLRTLEEARGDLPIDAVEGDLLAFAGYIEEPVARILCLGDTLTHLPSFDDVEALVAEVGAGMAPGGQFVATFRDYTRPLEGAARFIPVRSDADRILTCFLEYEDRRVWVHDVLHERDGDTWRMRVSRYPKLRLDPAWLVRRLEGVELDVRREAGPRGMVRVVATHR
jgi:SAM-dependent methyltransferase